MSKESRHHHYLSQCYLRGFTKDGTNRSKLTVIDIKEKKEFETKTRNVGGIRDFNTINIKGLESDKIEKDLSVFESKVAQALKKIEATFSFTGENKDIILNLIALFAVRSPEIRENWRKSMAQLAEKTMGLTLATKERWESQIERIKQDGYEVNDDASYENVKEFFQKKNYTIKIAREHHISMEFIGIDAILPYLYARKWVLIKSTDKSGPFITTDNPVGLSWKEPDKIPPFYRSNPGHGCSGTSLSFPLSKNLFLLGEFDGREGSIEGYKEFIAILNSSMMYFIHKQIYSPKIDFYFIGKDGHISDGKHIVNQFKS